MTAPADVIVDEMVTPVAAVLLACLAEAMGQVPKPPRVVSLRPGDRVEMLLSKLRDECCEGLAWVRPAPAYPSSSFPEQDTVPSRCGVLQWAVGLEMGAARCAPLGTVNNLPTAAEWTAVTRAELDDFAAMRRALCCFAQVDPDRLWLPGQWQPMTAGGGCVGSTITVTVAVPACDC